MSREGTVQESEGRTVLRYERRLDHPIGRVWSALTEPSELIGWLAEAEVDLVEGGSVVLRWQNGDAVMDATVTELDPPRLLEYAGEPHGKLRWELSEQGEGCVLNLTVELPDVPDEARDSARAGWHIHLDHLEDALDGRPVDWSRWHEEHRPRWQEIHDSYAQQT